MLSTGQLAIGVDSESGSALPEQRGDQRIEKATKTLRLRSNDVGHSSCPVSAPSARREQRHERGRLRRGDQALRRRHRRRRPRPAHRGRGVHGAARARRAAARPRRCGWSPASRPSPRARCASATGSSTTSRPRTANISMVFQSYALYPHMTVAKNIESPLLARKFAGRRRGRAPQADQGRARRAGAPTPAATLGLERAARPQARRPVAAASASAWPWPGPSSAARRRS